MVAVYLLHFKGKIPHNENDVIQTVLDTNINWLELGEMEEAPNIRHLLTSPAHLMWSYLKENRRARALYGDLVDKASIGVHRLMIIGVLIHWYMEQVGASDIDGAITSCELNFALWAKGALQSGQDSQPRFYSEFIPIYTEENVLNGVTAIIEAGVPVAVIPPRNVIHQNMTSDDYHSYYTEQMKVHRQGTREYELGHFNRRSRHEQNLAEGTCLFPPQSGHMSDWSQVDKAGYLYMEGARMVGLVKKVCGQTVQSSSNRMIPLTWNPPMTAWNPPVTPRQATQAEVHEALCIRPANPTSSTPHQPKVITLGQLQANRTMQLEKNRFSAYIASNDYLIGWSKVESEYLGRMGFHTTDERPLHVGDNIVLLSRRKTKPQSDDENIMHLAHVEYKVDHIEGSKIRIRYVIVLHDDETQSNVHQPIPAKLTVTIDGEYILWKKRASSSSSPIVVLGSRDEHENAVAWTGSTQRSSS